MLYDNETYIADELDVASEGRDLGVAHCVKLSEALTDHCADIKIELLLNLVSLPRNKLYKYKQSGRVCVTSKVMQLNRQSSTFAIMHLCTTLVRSGNLFFL